MGVGGVYNSTIYKTYGAITSGYFFVGVLGEVPQVVQSLFSCTEAWDGGKASVFGGKDPPSDSRDNESQNDGDGGR